MASTDLARMKGIYSIEDCGDRLRATPSATPTTITITRNPHYYSITYVCWADAGDDEHAPCDELTNYELAIYFQQTLPMYGKFSQPSPSTCEPSGKLLGHSNHAISNGTSAMKKCAWVKSCPWDTFHYRYSKTTAKERGARRHACSDLCGCIGRECVRE